MIALLGWIALAVIGACCAGFWGFLGTAFLYVLYYALLRPKVNINITGQEYVKALEDAATQRTITTALAMDRVARSIEPKVTLSVKPNGEITEDAIVAYYNRQPEWVSKPLRPATTRSGRVFKPSGKRCSRCSRDTTYCEC